jgi:hypothetical protein
MNTPDQIFAVLKACRTKPKFPAQVDVDGLDAYNPAKQSARCLAENDKAGAK